jgi:sialate O-acetylesterase
LLKNILLGEVWLCSGQSNMEWTAASGIKNGEEEIKNANYPEIRFFTVNTQTSVYPQEQCDGEWLECTPQVMKYSSAVGYFFARKIHQELDVPVGIIVSSWGGTPAEAWTSSQSIYDNKILSMAYKKLVQEPWGPKEPGSIFNGMINPIIPYTIKGVLWYQGEANTRNADTYEELLSTLINTWRKRWGYDFSFYICQIAPFTYGDDNINGGIVRDQQRRVSAHIKNTSLVVTSDIGDIKDIHPRNKQDVGLRLANIALFKDYKKDVQNPLGPELKGLSRMGKQINISFENTNAIDGFMTNGDYDYFQVAEADKKFQKVNAKVIKNIITLDVSNIKNPKYVRFAMGNTDSPNLFNHVGLPLSCFEEEIK